MAKRRQDDVCRRKVCLLSELLESTKVRAYQVISLLDVIGKLVEHTAAHLIAHHLERKRGYMMASMDVTNGGPAWMQWQS